VQQQHRLAGRVTRLHVGHPQQPAVTIRHLPVPRFVLEPGQAVEAVLRRAQRPHAADPYRSH
jgi:hypothetical protein